MNSNFSLIKIYAHKLGSSRYLAENCYRYRIYLILINKNASDSARIHYITFPTYRVNLLEVFGRLFLSLATNLADHDDTLGN